MDDLIEKMKNKKFETEKIESFRNYLQEIQQKEIILLGGYKGVALSKLEDNANIEEYQGTFYRDTKDGMPFGIVEVIREGNDDSNG